jgi:uncharacterized membrane protein YccC
MAMDEKLVERGWGRDDYLDTIRSLNGVIKRQRHSLKALHRSHNMSGKVCAGLARDMQAVRAEQREAAQALTLAQTRIRELEEAIWLAHDQLNTYRSAAVEEVIDKLETYIPGLSGKEAPNV